jgi:hypothetical protein
VKTIAFDGVADERDRIARVERVLAERCQQLPLSLRVRLPPPASAMRLLRSC